jgi:fumarate reductase (CoM/CoB) subunit B
MSYDPPIEPFTKRAQVKLFRCDPSQDFRPRYDYFEVPLEKGAVVLDVLRYIYENLDGTLAFEHGCRYGRCGLCAMKLNGEPRLACQTMAEPQMVIEPLSNFPIVKDLVVDRREMEERLKHIQPFLQRQPCQAQGPEILPAPRFETFRSVSRCIGCLSCLSSCPSFTLNRYAFGGPLVLVELARYAFDQRDTMDRIPLAHAAGLFNCFECGKCQEVCPQQIPIGERALQQLRSLALERKAVPPVVTEALENLITRGRPFRSAVPAFIEKMAVSGGKKEVEHERVGLFLGCTFAGDPRLKGIIEKTLEVLNKLQVDAAISTEEVCCGLPWVEMGQGDAASQLVKKNVHSLENEGFNCVVALCPGCGMVMKKEWPVIFTRLRGRPPRFRVEDFSEYLAGLLPRAPAGMKSLSLRVSFHDPCHLGRGQGIYSAPRQVLKSLPGVEVREMAEGARCCGGGGMVRSTNWKLAQAAAEWRVEDFKALQVDGVITTCPTCLLQISGALRFSGDKRIKVLHLVDLLHQSL